MKCNRNNSNDCDASDGGIATTFLCRRPLLPGIISVQSRGTRLFSRSRLPRSQRRPVKRLVVAPMLTET